MLVCRICSQCLLNNKNHLDIFLRLFFQDVILNWGGYFFRFLLFRYVKIIVCAGCYENSLIGFKKHGGGNGRWLVQGFVGILFYSLFSWLTTKCIHSCCSSCVSYCYLPFQHKVVYCLCRLHICLSVGSCVVASKVRIVHDYMANLNLVTESSVMSCRNKLYWDQCSLCK